MMIIPLFLFYGGVLMVLLYVIFLGINRKSRRRK